MRYQTEKAHLQQQREAEEGPRLKAVRQAHAVLARLLADPYPGLFSWQEAFHRALRQQAEAVGYRLDPVDPPR